MNSLLTAGVLCRPCVPSPLKTGRAHFSPLIWRRVWIASLPFCRIPSSTSVVRAVISSTEPHHVAKTQTEKGTEKVELACPVCFRPLLYSGFESPNLLTIKKSKLHCKNCRKSYNSDGGIIDLTLPYEGVISQGTSFFQNPFVAFIYERGYRDVFGAFNFPGFDEEAEMARELLKPARGEAIIDLSCGPGGFTRRFLVGGEYETVIAADFSLAMLEQCRSFLESDASADLSKVVLLRADAARLPFETGSVAGVHSAAAIHCWPNVLTSEKKKFLPSCAKLNLGINGVKVAEISRILRPGGVFVASTFLLPLPGLLDLKSVRQTIDQLQLPFNWFSEGDLRATTEACGLVNWYSYRRGIYILFAASKPI